MSSILILDEINLLLNSEEPKNTEIYGNLYEVLLKIKNLKAISLNELKSYQLDEVGQAALTYNKKSLMDSVKGEWYVETDNSEDDDKKVRCGLCNTPNKYLFFIRNRINNTRLNVGSSCMTKFPGIEGYTEYRYHLNKTIKNQKEIMRRTEFHKKFPEVIDILDSTNFYFDNLPVLLPYDLYYGLQDTVTNLRLLYSQYVNYGKKPFKSTKNSFELFSENIDRFNKIKQSADFFVDNYKNNPLICKREEIDWMIETKHKKLLDDIAKNNGKYSQSTAGEITSYNFIKKHFSIFLNCNDSNICQLNRLKNDNSQIYCSLNKSGYSFLFIVDTKKFMKQIGANCICDSEFKYNETDLLKVSQIAYTSNNLHNATNSITEELNRFGFYFLFDEDTDDMYIYKKVDKSVKTYSTSKFLKIYNTYFLEKSIDVYKFIGTLTSKNWISHEEQGKQGIDDKISKLYYQQYVEPYR